MPQKIPSGIKRIAVIYAENDIVGDHFFTPLLAQALHRYADMIQHYEAGHTTPEVFEHDNGTRLTVLGGLWQDGDYLPCPLPEKLRFERS